MEKIYNKIEEYLKREFPKKVLVLNNKLVENETTDIWGFNSIPIVTNIVGDTVQYRPIFNK